ncbi:hypothetical protein C0992_006510, partial [Termitomyces sp. T32_za158]
YFWASSPDDIHYFLENEQTLYAADMNTLDTHSAVLAARLTARSTDLVCDACKSKGQVNYTGHTKPWCILEGGGMAGKTIDEARTARVAHYKAKRENHDKKRGTTKLTFPLASGSAFTVEGNASTLAAYLASQMGKVLETTPKAEFAGLASDAIPGQLVDVESLEIDAWLALEEELMHHHGA